MFWIGCWIAVGFVGIGVLYWLLMHPERLERLEALQARARKWKYRNVKRVLAGMIVLLIADIVLFEMLPGWAFWSILLGVLFAELAIWMLYFRCPKCGKIVSGEKFCPYCGEKLHWK